MVSGQDFPDHTTPMMGFPSGRMVVSTNIEELRKTGQNTENALHGVRGMGDFRGFFNRKHGEILWNEWNMLGYLLRFLMGYLIGCVQPTLYVMSHSRDLHILYVYIYIHISQIHTWMDRYRDRDIELWNVWCRKP